MWGYWTDSQTKVQIGVTLVDFSQPIQWYPGHMTKAKKVIKNHLNLVDAVLEVVDARIPWSSRNPDIQSLLALKPRVVVLNKEDLADPGKTRKWTSFFQAQGLGAVPVDAVLKRGIKDLIQVIKKYAEPAMTALEAKGRRRRPVRVMIVGIPNVGKSTVINALIDQGAAKTGNKPGVTKGPQWIRLAEGLELLDTPGLLWPKFDDPDTGFKLAVTGAISDLVYSQEDVAGRLISFLTQHYPNILKERFKIAEIDAEPFITLEAIGRKRGFLASGGLVKLDQTAVMLLQEFRNGKLGRFTLDELPDNDTP